MLHPLKAWALGLLLAVGLVSAPVVSPDLGAVPQSATQRVLSAVERNVADSAAWSLTPGQKAAISGGYVPVYSCNYLAGAFCGGEVYSTTSLRTIQTPIGITYAPNNLLTYSNTFTNAAWGTNGTVTLSYGVADPFGGLTATTFTAGSANAYIVNSASAALPGNVLKSIWIRRRTGTGAARFYNHNNTLIPLTFTSSWTQVYDVGQCGSGGNYVVVQLDVSGDAVDIYAAVDSAVTYETTPSQRPLDQQTTLGAQFFGAAFDDDSTGAPLGLRVQEPRTNLFLNSNAPATQTITVASGSAYSISFYGTGVLTLSGALTQVMTGSAYPTRTTYTGTTATTTLVATVTTLGAMSYPQVELGGFATSAIPTGASPVTRAADVVGIVGQALGVLKGSQGAAFVDWISAPNGTITSGLLGTDSSISYINGVNISAFHGSTLNVGTNGATQGPGKEFRWGLSWSAAGRMASVIGVSPSKDANAAFGTVTVGYLGSWGNGYYLNGYIRKSAFYNVALPAPVLQRSTLLTTKLAMDDPANDNTMFAVNDNEPEWLKIVSAR